MSGCESFSGHDHLSIMQFTSHVYKLNIPTTGNKVSMCVDRTMVVF